MSHTLGNIIAYSVTSGVAQGTAGVVHFGVAAAMAANETKEIHHKQQTHKKTGGLRGFSRTRAKKEVAKTWAGAGAGSAGSVGVGVAVITGMVLFNI